MENEGEDFSWDDFDLDPEPEIEVKVEEPEISAEEVEENIENEIPETTEEVKEIEKEVEDEFARLDREESEKEVEEPEVEDFDGSIQTLEYLRDTGKLEFELEEGEELTDERAAELIEDSMFEAQELRIKELVQNLPPVVQDLVKFTTAGGDVDKFLESMQLSTSGDFSKDMDMEEVMNQKLVMRKKYADDGYDKEYAQTMIDALEDSSNLEKISKAEYNKFVKVDTAKQQELVEEQRQRQVSIKRQKTATLNESRKFFKETDVEGFSINKRERSDLPSYINTRSVDQGEGRYVSPMYRDLVKVLDTPVGVAQIAMLVKNHKDGILDFSNIASKAASKTTKNLKDNIRRAKSKPSTKSSKAGGKEDLAAFF